jgi:methionyl-tRNA synthetase
MIDRYREGWVPGVEPEKVLEPDFDSLNERVSELLDRAEITQALDEIWQRVRRLNRYVEESKPWELAKEASEMGRLDQVLYSLAEGLRVVSLLLHPFMPATTDTLLDSLGEEGRELRQFGSLAGGQEVKAIEPLFPRVEA